MRRPATLLVVTLAACSGHTPGTMPANTPAPAAPSHAPTGDPVALVYAPGAGRYRVESSFRSVSEVMGNATPSEGSSTLIVSAVAAASAGNLAVAFTVDSAVALGAAAGPPGQAADISAVRGTTYRAVYTGLGEPVSLVIPDTTVSIAVQVGENFRDFLPHLPAAPITVGQTWTDTSTNTVRQAGPTTIRTVSVRQHRVVGWEMHDGTRALHVATESHYSLSGDGVSQGQPIQLTGTGTGMVDRFVSATGVFLEQTARDTSNIMVNVTSIGMDIPVRQARRSSITRLP